MSVFLQWVEQSIRNVLEDADNARFLYLTYRDINGVCDESTVFAVQAPNGTQLHAGPVEQVYLVKIFSPTKVVPETKDVLWSCRIQMSDTKST